MFEEEWGQAAPVEAAGESEPGWNHQGFGLEYIMFIYIMFQPLAPRLKTKCEKKMRIETESYQEAAADLQKRQRRGWDSNRSYNQDKNLAVTAVCILRQHACA